MIYDPEIDQIIILKLLTGSSINYTDLKISIDEHLNRTISNDAFSRHLKKLNEENYISKEDQGRGKSVIYRLTESHRKKIVDMMPNVSISYFFYIYALIILINTHQLNKINKEDFNHNILQQDIEKTYFLFKFLMDNKQKKLNIKLIKTIETSYNNPQDMKFQFIKYVNYEYNIDEIQNYNDKIDTIRLVFSEDILLNTLNIDLKKYDKKYHSTEFHKISKYYDKDLLFSIYNKLAKILDEDINKIKEVIESEKIIKISSSNDDYFEFSDSTIYNIIDFLKKTVSKKRDSTCKKYYFRFR